MVTDRMRPVRVERQGASSGRASVPLGPARPHDRRRRERPHAHGARPERAHPGGQGAHLRHPARAPTARRRVAEFVSELREQARRAGSRNGPRRRADMTRLTETRRPAHTATSGKPRMGFFTDTSVCIGCKACEVACKEWNLIPQDGLDWTGESYDNTVAARREHVAARRVRRAAQAAAARRRDGHGRTEPTARAAALADGVATSASTARTPAASTSARPARSSAPSSARSSCRRTSATAAATASPPARSA